MRAADSRPLLLALGVCAILQFCRSEGQRHLDAALHHYDTLHVNHLKHTLPTGTTSTPHASSAHQLKREVEFYALEKKFHLHLVPHRGIFSKDFAAYVVDGGGRRTSHPVNLDEFYRGFLHDEETAIVVAHISEEGVLSASIKTSSEIYHIEPSENYIRTPHSFRMIAYRGSDVKRKSESKIDYVQTPLILEPDEDAEANSESSNHGAPGFHKSSYHSNRGEPDSKAETLLPHFRLKRQSTNLRGDLGGLNCRMILVADYFFSQRSVTEASTVRTLVTLVSAIDAQIYRPTQWIVGTGPDDIISELGLEIGSILVHTEPFTTTLAQAPAQYYNSAVLSDRNPDAGDVLDAFNLGDWRGYCLAHLFTFRNFDSGLLGLANIASPRRGETGGICSGRFNLQGRLINFNTGISTFNSDGNALIMEESRLVTGHELGHNWGSHHDPRECGDDFLMNEFAQDGSLATHMQFSSCSRRSIGLVLLAKGDCFSAPTALCGDFRVEDGEECDAGPAGDVCCNNVTCTLRRPEAECSDSNDDCCEGCRAASSETVCRFVRNSSLDCTVSTFCDGMRSSCPPAQPAAVNSSCSGGLCVRNDSTDQIVCTPLCTVLDRTSCLCTGTEECLVCCQDNEDNCVPAVIDDGMTSFSLSNGAACSNGVCLNGSCTDQFQPQDTITRLFNIITNLDINDLAQFVSENIVGCVLIFTAILWIPASCAIHFICDRGSSHDYTDWIPRRIHPMPHSREREREPLLDNEESSPTDKPEYVPEPVDDQPLPPSYSGRPAMDNPPSYSEKPPVESAASSIDEPLTRTYI